jgi:hypothetical protein
MITVSSHLVDVVQWQNISFPNLTKTWMPYAVAGVRHPRVPVGEAHASLPNAILYGGTCINFDFRSPPIRTTAKQKRVTYAMLLSHGNDMGPSDWGVDVARAAV